MTETLLERAMRVHKEQKAIVEQEMKDACSVASTMPLGSPRKPAGAFK